MKKDYQDLSKLAQEITQTFLDVIDEKISPLVYLRKMYQIKRVLTPEQILDFNRYLYQEAA